MYTYTHTHTEREREKHTHIHNIHIYIIHIHIHNMYRDQFQPEEAKSQKRLANMLSASSAQKMIVKKNSTFSKCSVKGK